MSALNQEVAERLAAKVREGTGLRQAVTELGLPWKETRDWLKKEHRVMFKEAKEDQKVAG